MNTFYYQCIGYPTYYYIYACSVFSWFRQGSPHAPPMRWPKRKSRAARLRMKGIIPWKAMIWNVARIKKVKIPIVPEIAVKNPVKTLSRPFLSIKVLKPIQMASILKA